MGPDVPSVDSIGRIYALMDSQPLRRFLCDIAHQLKRNKALSSLEGWYVAAIDGHEFFSSRKRCCPDCQKHTLTVDGQAVTEYYHQGVVCHLIGQNIRVGSGCGVAPARVREKRPLPSDCSRRIFADYPRFFDIVVGERTVLRLRRSSTSVWIDTRACDCHGEGGSSVVTAGCPRAVLSAVAWLLGR